MEVGYVVAEYGYVHNPRFMSCQELVDLRYEEFVTRRKEHTTTQAEYFLKQAEFLFPNDEKPNCGEDVLPKEWIKIQPRLTITPQLNVENRGAILDTRQAYILLK